MMNASTKYGACLPALVVALMGFSMFSLGATAASAIDPKLASQAKVDRPAAEKTALARVPGGTVKEGELEREHGKLVWSFDIAKPKTQNITEVQVDAISGKIVSVVFETPKDQAKEAAADKASAAKKAAPAPKY
jgi:Peptidase propeptide and YPEB domain